MDVLLADAGFNMASVCRVAGVGFASSSLAAGGPSRFLRVLLGTPWLLAGLRG